MILIMYLYMYPYEYYCTRSNENSTDTILKCPVGFGTPRQGGRLMRLTYFATPYELLDVKNPGENFKFSKDSKYNEVLKLTLNNL